MMDEDALREKILNEMVVDYSDALEKSYALAKKFIRITKDGKVDILFKDKLTGTEKISLYLIGKLYAKRAGLAETEYVNNKELIYEIGIPMNSLLPWLKTLRDKNIVNTKSNGRETSHTIMINAIEPILSSVNEKIRTQQQDMAESNKQS